MPADNGLDPSGVLRYQWGAQTPARPATADPEAYRSIQSASLAVLAGISGITALDPARSEIQAMIGAYLPDPGLAAEAFGLSPFLLARSDVMLTDRGAVVSELNVTSRLGLFLEHDLMARHLEQDAGFAGQLRSAGLRRGSVGPAFLDLVRTLLGDDQDATIAICHGKLSALQKKHYLPGLIRHELRLAGLGALVAPLGALTPSASGPFLGASGPIRLIYRLFGPDDLRDDPALAGYLHDQASRGSLKILDGFVGECLATKLVLAYLSDPRWLGQLPGTLADSLAQAVPWTRILADGKAERHGKVIDLLPFALRHRAGLVLKPGFGSGGVWVVIGPDVSQQEWETAIASAARSRSPWVIQDFAEPSVEQVAMRSPTGVVVEEPRIVNYCAIMVAGECVGIMRRDGQPGQRMLNTMHRARAVPLYRQATSPQ